MKVTFARFCALAALVAGLSACNPVDFFFPEDTRIGDEAQDICIGRVRAQMTYDQYQELENAPGRFVPTFTYDITLLDLAAIQDLVASGADETVGTRLIQQTNNTSAAVERFKLMKVDRKGALFLGRKPALYRVRGRTQRANTILASGCELQRTNTRLTEVTWVKAGSTARASEPSDKPDTPSEEIELSDIPNLGGVR